jgi:spore germination protein GerM
MRKIAFFLFLSSTLLVAGCGQQESEETDSRLPQPEPREIIEETVEEESQQPAEEEEEVLEDRQVKLFYYNKEKDREIAEHLPCSEDAVLPVERTIPRTETPLKDTIELLLEGNVTDKEDDEGFETEFPGEGFELEDIELENGTAVLTFSDPENFTIGGSCRTGLLYQQIKKTALQFEQIDEVIIRPETLFQP